MKIETADGMAVGDAAGQGGQVAIPYVSLNLSLCAETWIGLPDFAGSTLRGAFGHAFRRTVCALRKNDCGECILRDRCVYAYVFETPPPPGTARLSKYPHAPHPFVIEPPLKGAEILEPGSTFSFGLTVLGRAIDEIPYFVYSFRQMGETGIGKGKGRFRLTGVRAADGATVFDAGSDRVWIPPRGSVELFPESQGEVRRLKLEFLTPVRIRFEESFVSGTHFEFHMLVRNLLRRLSSLYYFHCGGDPEGWDFKGLIEQAKSVRSVRKDLRWHDWERYSSRQKTTMTLGGLLGSVELEGDLGRFVPLLRAAEVLRVGKAATFGLGRIKVTE